LFEDKGATPVTWPLISYIPQPIPLCHSKQSQHKLAFLETPMVNLSSLMGENWEPGA